LVSRLVRRGVCPLVVRFFFFSSRRRHTRCYRDWSSDVCSSDLKFGHRPARDQSEVYARVASRFANTGVCVEVNTAGLRKPCRERSEERRVGKEGRSGGEWECKEAKMR